MALPISNNPFQQAGSAQGACAANLSTVDEETASPEVKLLYQRFRNSFGRPQVPGILQCFATHPPLLEHMLGLAEQMLFVDGALGRQNKELISTYVSAINRCAYCADSHAHSFCMQGGGHAAVTAALACDARSPDLTEQQQALLRFAHAVTESSHAVCPEDVGLMRAAGFRDLQIAEAIHVSALFAAFNRVVNAFGLPSQNLLAAPEEEKSNAR